jgi:hypothetical protein
LANALVATGAIDLAQLPDLLSWSASPESALTARRSNRADRPGRWAGDGTPRFLVGSALAAPNADLLRRTDGQVGNAARASIGPGTGRERDHRTWLPRAPQTLLQAVRQVARRNAKSAHSICQCHSQVARGRGNRRL